MIYDFYSKLDSESRTAVVTALCDYRNTLGLFKTKEKKLLNALLSRFIKHESTKEDAEDILSVMNYMIKSYTRHAGFDEVEKLTPAIEVFKSLYDGEEE